MVLDIPDIFTDTVVHGIGSDPTTLEPIDILVGQNDEASFRKYAFSQNMAAAIQRFTNGYTFIFLRQLPPGVPQIQFDLEPIVVAILNRELYHDGKAPWPADRLADLLASRSAQRWRYIPRAGQLINDDLNPAPLPTQIPFDEVIDIVSDELLRQIQVADPVHPAS